MEARYGRGEDRFAVRMTSHRLQLVVADGAGGTTGGEQAAEMACEVLLKTDHFNDPSITVAFEEFDELLFRSRSGGQSTAVALEILDGHVRGASVGDCCAWVFRDGVGEELTRGQKHKPLLGSGNTCPVAFSADLNNGTLVVASDGLWKYVEPHRVMAALLQRFEEIPSALIELARLPNKKLQDDIVVVVVRNT